MRLWSLHPMYLDAQGLVALWREALLARAVLRGQTRGYRHHPQLARFKAHPAPLSAINEYLQELYGEAARRGYSFDRTKIGPVRRRLPLSVSAGQLQFEWTHLLAKLRVRKPALHQKWCRIAVPQAHPLFRVRRGNIARWERLTDSPAKLGVLRARKALD
jgi:Pyrimidine dimer DNA glycosylase